MTRALYLLVFITLLSLGVLYKSSVDVVESLSPQGCRMSYMSPSYILQTSFDRKWTPLAKRYSLYLYREVGWETHELHGSPVLFIPGNAGSSQQARSIASSATRQYFEQPGQVASEFVSAEYRALDFFTVEFNEDLSAFHGTTLETEREYASRAIDYILSLYPANTSILILGHSMGGVVATSLLPHDNIAAIITMSTPYTLPPARFDRRIEGIFTRSLHSLTSDPTPILSLCGGATDLMVPSESCYIPNADVDFVSAGGPYRRTIFTSALEGCWTGVGHREMVWCHQVRWRIAKAAIHLAKSTTVESRASVLDYWLRDGHLLPPYLPVGQETHHSGPYDPQPEGQNLILKHPQDGTFFFPIPQKRYKFVVYLLQGMITPVSPQHRLPLRVKVESCSGGLDECKILDPTTLKLLPNPVPGRPFPVPQAGADESEGVVMFENDLSDEVGSLSISVSGADGRGWVVAGYVQLEDIVDNSSAFAPFWSTVSVKLPPHRIQSTVYLPHLLSNALVVYQVTPHVASECPSAGIILQPLLEHVSHSSESHYFPLNIGAKSPILLHTHASAPYILRGSGRGLNLTIHSSGECTVDRLNFKVDWWGTVGRWGIRYWSALGSWAVGVVSLMVWLGWGSPDTTGVASVHYSLSTFSRKLRVLLPVCLILSFLPLPVDWWLGNGGEPLFALIAPMLILIVTGLVSLSWTILLAIMWPLSTFVKLTGTGSAIMTPTIYSKRNTVASLAFIFLFIFLLVPWQVAFLGCWMFQLFTCAATRSRLSRSSASASYPITPTTPELLNSASDPHFDAHSPTESERFLHAPTSSRFPGRPTGIDESLQNANEHLLLLMTWLLPLSAPVLAVWVRTLMTAGYTTPFDGDHNVLYVAPFLVLVEVGTGIGGFMVSRTKGHGRLSVIPRYLFLVLAGAAMVFGPRYTYVVFDSASAVMGVTVFINAGRYFRM